MLCHPPTSTPHSAASCPKEYSSALFRDMHEFVAYPKYMCILPSPIPLVSIIRQLQVKAPHQSRKNYPHLRVRQFHAQAAMSADPKRLKSAHIVAFARLDESLRDEGVRTRVVVALAICRELVVCYICTSTDPTIADHRACSRCEARSTDHYWGIKTKTFINDCVQVCKIFGA